MVKAIKISCISFAAALFLVITLFLFLLPGSGSSGEEIRIIVPPGATGA